MSAKFTNETIELLQALIRNRCVNDGSVSSGNEIRNVQTLIDFFGSSAIDFSTFEPEPGRTSLVSRLPGSDPKAPSLCLMGHTDVVPVSPEGWRHDPFGGERIGDEIWGRGAVDMLNLTSSMAVAFREFSKRSKPYPGDIVFFAVADEEAGGTYGAQQLVNDHWDVLQSDYVLTEYGGIPLQSDKGTSLLITTAEKGVMWRRLIVKGTPGHGSMPYLSDNALVKAAEVIRRISSYHPNPLLDEMWTARIKAMGLEKNLEKQLLDRTALQDAFLQLPPEEARNIHACCHTTFSANVVAGGSKTNTIPDSVVIEVDIRSLPGESSEDIDRHLKHCIGDLWSSVTHEKLQTQEASSSVAEGRLWDALSKASQIAYPEASTIASRVTGATDARFFREKGSVVYGAGLLSQSVSGAEFFNRFHGHNERIDTESLRLTTNLWFDIVNHFWE